MRDGGEAAGVAWGEAGGWPGGGAITTRLRTTPEDERVLDLVARHVGGLRRADLAAVSRPAPLDPAMDDEAKRQARRDRLNTRKKAVTAQSSARWANAIIAGNDAQYRSASDAQHRHLIGLRAAIATIEKRLAQPTDDTLSPEQRRVRRKAKLARGYATQAERFQKQRRLQVLRATLGRVQADWDNNRVHVVEGGKRLAKIRHNLDSANLSGSGWREQWDCARDRIEAKGSGDEPFGNLTITVTPEGEVSLRLPKPLEHLANAPYGRYILSGRAVFAYRGDEWRARITGGQSVAYAITRRPGRGGRYLTAAWACPATTSGIMCARSPNDEVRADGPVVGVDLNDGHLAVRRLDEHGNPVGRPERIDVDLSGSSARRDAQVRHAITRVLHYTRRHGIDTVAVEDLDFADARTIGRETMGRGSRGKRFRKSVAGIPTAVFRDRLTAQTSRHGIDLFAVNAAYSSVWGDQHWRTPYLNVTRHQAAATVIGRRAQGLQARRRKGVTRTRPEDRVVGATDQAAPENRQVSTSNRHRPGMRGTKSRPPSRARTASRNAATGWRALDVAERVARVAAAATTAGEQLKDRDGARLYTSEHGKVLSEAAFEIDTGPLLAAVLGSMAEAALTPEQIDAHAPYPRLHREPYGVAALVIPFNWPLAVMMTKLTSALTAGNTAVVKLPPTCPLAALQFGAAFAAALPPGVVNVLTAPGVELAQALVTHPGIDVISLTGGPATGRAVMAAAAPRLTPLLLELGGNDAAIIAPDMTVSDQLVEQLVAATYTTGGQVCMAIKRLYAPRDRVDELSEAVLARCEREIVGDGLADEVTLGPLHTAAGRDRVDALVKDAAAQGATVRTGGRIRGADADAGGYFVLPTVVTDVAPDSALASEEQFGPVLPIFGYDTIDDAVAAANATDFGLTASVWTGDDALADKVAAQLIAGTVSVNCHGMAAQDPRVPFGGVGQSGLGRELGVDGIRAFTQARGYVRQPAPQ